MAITVHEITMAAPDVICVEVWDSDIGKYESIQLGSPDPSGYGATVQRSTVDGTAGGPNLKWCIVQGENADYLRFYDDILVRADLLDRVASDNAANYPTIGGMTVTSVNRWTTIRDQGFGYSSGSFNVSSFKHYLYLKLSGNLPQGGPYSISNSGGAFPTTNFTFNDKSTRAQGIRATQTGHRPRDGSKIASFAQWIPGYGTEGRVDLRTYGLSQAYIIDASNNPVYTCPITLYYKGTWIEPETGITIKTAGTGYTVGDVLTMDGCTGTPPGITVTGINAITGAITTWTYIYGDPDSLPQEMRNITFTGGTGSGVIASLGACQYPSTTQPTLTITSINTATKTIGYSGTDPFVGEVLVARGVFGTTNLEGSLIQVDTVDTVGKTFTIGPNSYTSSAAKITTLSGTWVPGQYKAGYDGILYRMATGNRSNTFVFHIDYSAWYPSKYGTYRVWIPGLGVSDPFIIDEAIHYTSAINLAKGIYNQTQGIDKTGYGGWTHPASLYDDGTASPPCKIYESNLIGGWVAWGTQPYTAPTSSWPSGIGSYGGFHPFFTTTRATGFGKGLHDAGDWAFDAHVHTYVGAGLAETYSWPTVNRLEFGWPKASTTLADSGIYSGIDYMGDVAHMALFELETFRRTQKADGRIYSKKVFGSLSFVDGGAGGTQPSWSIKGNLDSFNNAINGPSVVALAAEPEANYSYAYCAGKAAQMFYAEGETTLGDLWKNSAISAFNWAESLWADYYAGGAVSAATFTGSGWLTVSGVTGTIAIGQMVVGNNVPAYSKISGGSGTSWSIDKSLGTNGTGVYSLPSQSMSTYVPNGLSGAQITGYIDNGSGGAGNILTVTGITQGIIRPADVNTYTGIGQMVSDPTATLAVRWNTRILTQLSGTPGGVGTYQLDGSAQLVSSAPGMALQASLVDGYFNGDLNGIANCAAKLLAFSTNLSAGNVFNVTINGTPISPVTYATSHNATIAAIITAIQTADPNVTCDYIGYSRSLCLKGPPYYTITITGASVTGGSAVTLTTYAGATTAQYNTALNTVFTSSYTPLRRDEALGVLFRLTNDPKYGDLLAARFGLATGVNMLHEFLQTPHATTYTYNNSSNFQTVYLSASHGILGQKSSITTNLAGLNSFQVGYDTNYFGTGGSGTSISLWKWDTAYPQNESNPYLKLAHSVGNYTNGANQQGMSVPIGNGVRNPEIALIRDRESQNVSTSSVLGITPYMWSYNNYPAFVFYNLASGNNASNWSYVNPYAATGTNPDVDRYTIDPYYTAIPARQSYYANSYIIYCSEFTIEQTIWPTFQLELFRHCHDGNLSTTLRDGFIASGHLF